MFTEDDLRTTLGALEREAPDPDDVLAGLDRLRRRHTVRRRTVGTVAVALLAIVVTAGSIVVAGPTRPAAHDTPPPVDTHSERLRFPFAVEVPGYEVALQNLNVKGGSTAWIGTPTDFATGNFTGYELRVYAKGRYDPTADRTGEPVEVNGRPGFYRTDAQCFCTGNIGAHAVIWEYAPDSWAQVQYPSAATTPDVREVIMSIATAVRFDRTTPVPVPFRIGYLPAGLRPSMTDTATVNTVPSGNLSARLYLTAPGRRTMEIMSVWWGDDAMPVGEPVVTDSGTSLTGVSVNLGQFIVTLKGADYSVEELAKVARSIEPAKDLHDTTTWFDADQAIAFR